MRISDWISDVCSSDLLERESLATRSALARATTELRGDIAQATTDLRGEIAQVTANLRGEIAEVTADLRGEIAEATAGLRGEISGLRLEKLREVGVLRDSLNARLLTVIGLQFGRSDEHPSELHS